MKDRLRSLLLISAAILTSLISTQAANVVTFRDGVNGYAGTQDTFISSGSVTTDNGADTTIEIDQEDIGGEFLLLRFDNIFGSATNQIPLKSRILYATLSVHISNTGNGPLVHRMLVPWQETSTWESLVDGILADDVEAAVIEDATFPGNGTPRVFPLAASTLQGWSDGTSTNYGWVFLPTGTDGTDFSSSEHATVTERPMLTVVWSTVDEPFIVSVTPDNGASNIPPDANIQLVVRDSETKLLNDASVQLFVNNQRVTPTVDRSLTDPAETIIIFDPPANFASSTRIPIRLVYSDAATPARFTTNDFSFTTRANTTVLVAIDDKQVWRYDRSGTDMGTAWKEKVFADTTWEQGMAIIADETATLAEPIRTPITRFNDAGDYVATFYFRTHFTYTGPLGGNLFLRYIIDDGAIFYLNGTPIHWAGYPTGATPAFNNTGATGPAAEGVYVGPITLSGLPLVNGDNVFAVEVHQSGTSSSDVVFGAELVASISNIPPTSLVSVSPANNATDVPANTSIEITLADGSRQVQTNSIQLSVNGQAVTATVTKPTSLTTKITHTPASSLAPNAKIAVKLVYGDNATPPNLVTNEFSFTTKGITLVNIDDKTKWRYDRSGVDLGTAWKEKTFNDSAWPEGAALIGEEATTVEPLRTAVSRLDDAGSVINTMYFRTHFTFTGDPKTALLKLRHVIDDGAVFYLNGVEIHRFGLAAGATFDFTTFFTSHENAYSGPYDINVASLVQGDNVLAVEVHQTDSGSSDIVFGAELVVVTQTSTAPKFTAVSRTGTNLNLVWTGTGTLQSAPAVAGPWTDVANAQSPFTAAISGTARFYRLR